MERSSSIESLPPISTQWSNPGVLASCLPPASALLDDDDDDGGDVSWGVDTSTEAVRERQAALSVATAGITINDDLALPENDRLEIFFNFTTAEHEKGRVNGGNRTVFDEAKRLEVQDKAIFIISEVIFNDNVLTQLVDYQRFILQVCFLLLLCAVALLVALCSHYICCCPPRPVIAVMIAFFFCLDHRVGVGLSDYTL